MCNIGRVDFHVMVAVFSEVSGTFSGKGFFSLIIGKGRSFVPIMNLSPLTEVSLKATPRTTKGFFLLLENVAVVV